MLTRIYDSFNAFIDFMWGWPLLILILGGSIYFTVRTGFYQFRYFGKIFKTPFKRDPELDSEDKKNLTPFQAVCIAVGGCIGTANISGVATAIATGGPGALFWMFIAALLGMVLKLVETTLAVYYRRTNEDGTFSGGPTYYMKYALGKEKGFKGWKVPAIVFGIGIFTVFFITLQNYNTAEAVSSTFNCNFLIPAFALTACTYAIILGGLKRVGRAASYLVPFMCIFYIGCVIIVLIVNISALPGAIALIFKSAFSAKAVTGGVVGSGWIYAMRLGVARSVYSNEAGWGTSAMVHATAKTNHPVKQGVLASFECIADTMLVCTATGLAVIVSGFWDSGLVGATLTLTAIESAVGSFARGVIAISIFLFALTTATGWFTYYRALLIHAFKGKTQKVMLAIQKYEGPLNALIISLATYYLGGTPVILWNFADFTEILPTFINIIVIIILTPQFMKLYKDYKARYLGIGEVDPNMHLFYEEKVIAEGGQLD